jgi:hypothetical protein
MIAAKLGKSRTPIGSLKRMNQWSVKYGSVSTAPSLNSITAEALTTRVITTMNALFGFIWRTIRLPSRGRLRRIARRQERLVTKIKISLPNGFAYQQGFSSLAERLAKLPP